MNKGNQGFTITELLVAASVFAIVIVIVVGIFIQGLRSQRILSHLMAINDNTALVIEQVAREIRTGYDFSQPDPSTINFFNFTGEPVVYDFDGETGRLARNGIVLTTPEADIEEGMFLMTQEDNDPDLGNDACNPWRISVFMTVRSADPDISQSSRIQTTISSRILPLDAPNADQGIIDLCSHD